MDEGVFIIIALVITLGLIAGLYFTIDLLSQRVLGLASEARGREQYEIVNDERLARKINELVDEMADLTEALKNERILRSHVFIAAWRAICGGGFYPRPDRDLHHALRRWLAGIARRQASAYRRTSRYGSIVSELPVEEHDVAIESTTENQVDDRSYLKLFERVPRKHREVLVLIALGAEPIEAARELGISREASLARIRYGRAWFERVLARWRRGRGSQ